VTGFDQRKAAFLNEKYSEYFPAGKNGPVDVLNHRAYKTIGSAISNNSGRSYQPLSACERKLDAFFWLVLMTAALILILNNNPFSIRLLLVAGGIFLLLTITALKTLIRKNEKVFINERGMYLNNRALTIEWGQVLDIFIDPIYERRHGQTKACHILIVLYYSRTDNSFMEKYCERNT
jgi:hypothetical protein